MPLISVAEKLAGGYEQGTEQAAMIADNSPTGIPAIARGGLAQTYWTLHAQRDHAGIVLPA